MAYAHATGVGQNVRATGAPCRGGAAGIERRVEPGDEPATAVRHLWMAVGYLQEGVRRAEIGLGLVGSGPGPDATAAARLAGSLSILARELDRGAERD